jgi:hypothetical protein
MKLICCSALILVILSGSVVSSGPAAALPPTNDRLDGASALSESHLPVSHVVNMVEATSDLDDDLDLPDCVPGDMPTVWYRADLLAGGLRARDAGGNGGAHIAVWDGGSLVGCGVGSVSFFSGTDASYVLIVGSENPSVSFSLERTSPLPVPSQCDGTVAFEPAGNFLVGDFQSNACGTPIINGAWSVAVNDIEVGLDTTSGVSGNAPCNYLRSPGTAIGGGHVHITASVLQLDSGVIDAELVQQEPGRAELVAMTGWGPVKLRLRYECVNAEGHTTWTADASPLTASLTLPGDTVCRGGTGSYVAGPSNESPTGYGFIGQLNLSACSHDLIGSQGTGTLSTRAALQNPSCSAAAPTGSVIAYGYYRLTTSIPDSINFPGTGVYASMDTGEFTGQTVQGTPSDVGHVQGDSFLGSVTFSTRITGGTCDQQGNVTSFTVELVDELSLARAV